MLMEELLLFNVNMCMNLIVDVNICGIAYYFSCQRHLISNTLTIKHLQSHINLHH